MTLTKETAKVGMTVSIYPLYDNLLNHINGQEGHIESLGRGRDRDLIEVRFPDGEKGFFFAEELTQLIEKDDPYELGLVSGNAHSLILDIDPNDSSALMPYAEKVFQSLGIAQEASAQFYNGYGYGYSHGKEKQDASMRKS